jgi:hypothetical protein
MNKLTMTIADLALQPGPAAFTPSGGAAQCFDARKGQGESR